MIEDVADKFLLGFLLLAGGIFACCLAYFARELRILRTQFPPKRAPGASVVSDRACIGEEVSEEVIAEDEAAREMLDAILTKPGLVASKPWKRDIRYSHLAASDGPDEDGMIHFTDDETVRKVHVSQWFRPTGEDAN